MPMKVITLQRLGFWRTVTDAWNFLGQLKDAYKLKRSARNT